MKKKNFKFDVGTRVSLAKRPDAHGTITECVGRDIPLYLVKWDDTPNQLLLQLEQEIMPRAARVQNPF